MYPDPAMVCSMRLHVWWLGFRQCAFSHAGFTRASSTSAVAHTYNSCRTESFFPRNVNRTAHLDTGGRFLPLNAVLYAAAALRVADSRAKTVSARVNSCLHSFGVLFPLLTPEEEEEEEDEEEKGTDVDAREGTVVVSHTMWLPCRTKRRATLRRTDRVGTHLLGRSFAISIKGTCLRTSMH